MTLTFALAAALLLAFGRGASASRAGDCPSGAEPANFSGKIVCLQVGAPCDAALAPSYPDQGYQCNSGKLENAPTARPLHLPAAAALPAKTLTIAIPEKDVWAPDSASLAASAHAIWTASGLFRITAAGNEMAGPFTQTASQDIAAGKSSVWASDFGGGTLSRFDAGTGKTVATISMPGGPEGIAVTPTAVWVAEHHGGDVARVDPITNKVIKRVQAGPPGAEGPQGIAFGLGSIWTGVGSIDQIDRIDPTTNKVVARIAFSYSTPFTPCGGIAVGRTAVWASSCLEDSTIARIDPATNTVASIITLPGKVNGMTAVGNDVWFVEGGDPDISPHATGSLIELGPDDTVKHRYALGRGFISSSVVNAFGSLWVSNWIKPVVLRIPDPNA
jgi:virginiamycin B lyase